MNVFSIKYFNNTYIKNCHISLHRNDETNCTIFTSIPSLREDILQSFVTSKSLQLRSINLISGNKRRSKMSSMKEKNVFVRDIQHLYKKNQLSVSSAAHYIVTLPHRNNVYLMVMLEVSWQQCCILGPRYEMRWCDSSYYPTVPWDLLTSNPQIHYTSSRAVFPNLWSADPWGPRVIQRGSAA